MASSYHSGMKGRPTEVLQECPYDKNHKVAPNSFHSHVEKCRRNYKLRTLRAGKNVDVFVCQYNPDHLVYGPELVYHEERICEARTRIRDYQLNAPKLFEAAGQPAAIPKLKLFMEATKKQQHAEIFKGIDIGVIQGSQGYGKKFSVEDVKYPYNALIRRKQQEQEQELAKKMEAVAIGEKKGKKESKVSDGTENMTEEEKAEHEDWNKRCGGGPAFSYMDNISNPRENWHRYPVDYTKAERKEFEKRCESLASGPGVVITPHPGPSGTCTWTVEEPEQEEEENCSSAKYEDTHNDASKYEEEGIWKSSKGNY